MARKALRGIVRHLSHVRPGLLELVVFLVLLAVINYLLVNQRVVLYLFYIPIVISAWYLDKRGAVSLACLGALLVIAYAFFIPNTFDNQSNALLFWSELAIWAGILVLTAYLISFLRVKTEEAMRNLDRAYRGVLAILSKFIQTVDADTEAHSTRVSMWSVRIGKAMGMAGELVEEVRVAGLLHDVGKVEVSVGLLRKAAALSKEEETAVREHVSRGAAMVKPVGGMLTHIAEAIEAHHEKYDGTGYRGLQGEEIPLIARIIAVADAFDALLSDRPYRKGVSIFEAMDAIIASSSGHFDPKIVTVLQEIVNREGEQILAQIHQSVATSV